MNSSFNFTSNAESSDNLEPDASPEAMAYWDYANSAPHATYTSLPSLSVMHNTVSSSDSSGNSGSDEALFSADWHLCSPQLETPITPALSTDQTVEPLCPLIKHCDCGCGGGATVPQRPYQAPSRSEQFNPSDPITFSVNGGCGISIKDALEDVYQGLEGRDDEVLTDNGTSISIRLEWPGIARWSKQIKTQNYKQKPSPIPKSKLAFETAKVIKAFIEEMDGKAQYDPFWRVGTGDITVDHLVLVSLTRVSKGSWQPTIRLIAF